MKLIIDIGGTYLRYQIKQNNITLKQESLKSKNIGLCEFIEKILTDNKDISIIAISYAGQIHNGKILSSPNIKIDKKDIKEYFENRYKVKLLIENDLNCAVLAQKEYFNVKDIAALYIGTGLGLGVVSSNTLIKGFRGIATELGHIPYKKSPFVCSCGKNNCLELFASGGGLKRWLKKYYLNISLNLEELKNSKNKYAQKIYKEFIEAFLYACGVAITLFNPKVLALGGGVIKHNDYLLKILKQNIKQYAMPISLKDIQITKSMIDDAPIKGAELLIKEKNV